MNNFAKLKRFFVFCLIGSLIVSAFVAVVAVLMGNFNEVTVRVFATLGMVVVHSLASLLFIWDDERQDTFERFAFFVSTLFVLVILSFLASIFGIWKIFSGEVVYKIYQTFFLVGFASLHADILSKILKKEGYINLVVYTNYLIMFLVFSMLLPVIYINKASMILGEFYFRVVGALGIVDGTLSILAIIFYKLYLHNHPQVQNVLSPGAVIDTKVQRRGLSLWVWLLLIYLAFQMLSSIVYFGAYKASQFMN
jgi:hypothetical protein